MSVSCTCRARFIKRVVVVWHWLAGWHVQMGKPRPAKFRDSVQSVLEPTHSTQPGVGVRPGEITNITLTYYIFRVTLHWLADPQI